MPEDAPFIYQRHPWDPDPDSRLLVISVDQDKLPERLRSGFHDDRIASHWMSVHRRRDLNKEQLVARTRPNRWIALMVCDPRVTARELTHLAEVLGTTTTWLLTGRQPEPTPHALRRHTTAQGGPTP